MTDAEGYEVLRTPAFKAVMRELLAAGSWLARWELEGCAAVQRAALGSTVALENALADVVMLGLVEFSPATGYRLKQPALARQAGQALAARPDLDRMYVAKQRAGQVDVGVAVRLPDGDVVLCALTAAEPAGAGVQWAADAVARCMRGEVAHG